MAKTHTTLQVFVASPSDMDDERSVLPHVVSEFNQTWGSPNGIILDLLRWETHSHPGIGQDGQDVINNQIGDEYDIFLGLMWGRFGTPTNRAESGTEEEFQRAYARLTSEPGSVQIMFYFKDAGIPPSKINSEQLQKVQDFKKTIAKEYGALYHEFETTEQFQTKVRMHLSALVQQWMDGNVTSQLPEIPESDADNLTDSDDPLANLSALEHEPDDEGVIELVEIASDAMNEVTSIIQRMSDATNDLSERFTSLAEETNGIVEKGANMKAAKRVSNKAADDLELFVTRMAVEIREFNKQSTLAMDTFGNIAMISERDLDEDSEDITEVRHNMQGYKTAITESAKSLTEFRNVIFKLPRMTTAFNRARKRAVAVLDDLLNQLRIAADQSQDVDDLLARLEAKPENAH